MWSGKEATTGRFKRLISAAPWYQWLAAAAVLFAIGVGALAVLSGGETAADENGTGLLGLLRRRTTATGATHTIAYSAWLLSWLGAVVSTVFGVARIWKPPPKMG